MEIVKIIEKYKKKIEPGIIFTHYENDLNIDHKLTYQAVLTATRPLPNETVKEIYSFEVISSTEFNYPLYFSPDIFFDITNFIKVKQKAMAVYSSELRDYPHPRSLKGIEILSKCWGLKTGVKYAEAFKLIRSIK